MDDNNQPDVRRAPELNSAFLVNGWLLCITQGMKAPGDRKIWVSSSGDKPSLMSLAATGAIVRLWYDNEDRCYPYGKGGMKVLEFLKDCCARDLGWACRRHQLPIPKVEERPWTWGLL